ncbi:MAG: cysteine protease StiP family protein [Alphaproteobacteria bacterium]|nr:cysteine protease StiP family protein [Alphaproteobacteria bacterium]MBF0391257.1 cysteine protease StiP family protein [Alphaproteobacteria bacterium]
MMGLEHGFSGSYDPTDVTFLLKPVRMAFVDVAEKEAQIQSGLRHYSEMLAPENAPNAKYFDAFRAAFEANRGRVGRDVARLAKTLALRDGNETVLVSLARAGTPVGVLLKRTLAALGRKAVHYSVSIIRDRGIDLVAMKAILGRHSATNVVFVDGWTGKGAIAKELARAVFNDFPELVGAPVCVLSDLAGVADIAAGDEDYVIPSAILNGVVSGLVSRTVLNAEVIGPGDFHGCVVLHHLVGMDLSRSYVDGQMEDVLACLEAAEPALWGVEERSRATAVSSAFVDGMLAKTGTKQRNRIKPGIGEATRALLRRMPEWLFVRDPVAGDVRHLMSLAAERGVAVESDPSLAYGACAVITTLGDA